MRRHLAATASCLALALLFSASGLAQAPMTLRLKPKKGSVYKFSTVTESSSPGQSGKMTMSAVQTQKVTAVQPDRITLEISTSNVKATGAGAAQADEMAKIKVTTVMNSMGKILSSKATGSPMAEAVAASMTTSGFGGIELPQKAVSVGSTWTGVFDLGKTLAASGLTTTGGKLNITYKLVKLSKSAATIEQSFSGGTTANPPQGAQGGPMKITMTGKSTMVLNVTDGMLMSTSGTVTTSISAGAQFSMTTKTTTTSKRV